MKCKSCKRDIADDAIFCQYCGAKQLREKRKREISVPTPRKLPSGNYFAQMMVGGQRISITAQSEKEYYAKAKALKAGLIEVSAKKSEMTLKQAITHYISDKQNRLASTSIQQYEYIRDNRFQSVMDMKLSDINSNIMDSAVDAELAKPSRKGGRINPKTVNDAYHLVATVIKRYGGNKLDVATPEVQRSFPELLTPSQIYDAVRGTDIELPVLLAMWLSLSMSEIRGLTKSKSIRGDKLYVVETVVDVGGKPQRRSRAKEENRPRCLDIHPYIKALIDGVDGDVIEPRSGHAVYMRFQTELKHAGLPQMSFHGLRHINASVMAELIPSNIAQERGGWKTDYTMKRVYTHTFTESRKQADAKIDAVFEGVVGWRNGQNEEKSEQITNEITNEKSDVS